MSNFSNIFFGKPNISTVKFVELFPLVSCFFFPRKFHSKLGFSRFCGLFIEGSKTKSAVCCYVLYDMGNREEAINNKLP